MIIAKEPERESHHLPLGSFLFASTSFLSCFIIIWYMKRFNDERKQTYDFSLLYFLSTKKTLVQKLVRKT